MSRDGAGAPSPGGPVWGCPYRWGATLVAVKADALARRGGRPVREWRDLLQPALRGRVAFPESSREFVGIALRTLAEDAAAAEGATEGEGSGGGGGGAEAAGGAGSGAARRYPPGLGFNADASSLAAAGVAPAAARARVRALLRQARAFSDRDHARTLAAGDALAVVGTSEDLVPLVERAPSLELVAPASGTPLWADLWVVPAGATGGHMRAGPSPLLPAWLEFGVLPARVGDAGVAEVRGRVLHVCFGCACMCFVCDVIVCVRLRVCVCVCACAPQGRGPTARAPTRTRARPAAAAAGPARRRCCCRARRTRRAAATGTATPAAARPAAATAAAGS